MSFNISPITTNTSFAESSNEIDSIAKSHPPQSMLAVAAKALDWVQVKQILESAAPIKINQIVVKDISLFWHLVMHERWDIVLLILQKYPDLDLDFNLDSSCITYCCEKLIKNDLFVKVLNHYIVFNHGIIKSRSSFIHSYNLEYLFHSKGGIHDYKIKYLHFLILLNKPFYTSMHSMMEEYNFHKNKLLHSFDSVAMFSLNDSFPKEISTLVAIQSLYDQFPHFKEIPEFFLVKVIEHRANQTLINLNKNLINRIAKKSFKRLISINNVLIITSPEQRKVSMKLISRELEKYPIEKIRKFSYRIVIEIGKNQGLPFPILNKDLVITAIRKVLSSEPLAPLCSSRIDETITAPYDPLDQNSHYFD